MKKAVYLFVFSLLLISKTVSANLIYTGTIGYGYNYQSGQFNNFAQSYDAFTFSLTNDTDMVFDMGGSYDLYATDTFLTLFSGTNVNPNTQTPIIIENDDASSSIGRIATGSFNIDSLDSLINVSLAAGDYTLYVTNCCNIPGVDLNTIGTKVYFQDSSLDPNVYSFNFESDYQLTVLGASLTKVNSTPVPTPSATLLFGLGFLLLTMKRKAT